MLTQPQNIMKPEHHLLLLCARLHLDAQTERTITEILSTPHNPEPLTQNSKPKTQNCFSLAQNSKLSLDWPQILESANRLGIAPLMHKHLSRPDWRQKFPTQIREEFEAAYQKSAFRALRIQGQIKKINQAAADRHIPVIFLKGAALSQWLYEDIAPRPMSDIDILCPEKHNPQIDQLLKELGYSQNLSIYKSPIHKMMGEKMSHLAPYSRANAAAIEVHN